MARNARSFLVDKIEFPGKPGAMQLVRRMGDEKVVGFNHACPCGCGAWSFVALCPEAWAPGSTVWTRTGDDLHMTVAPSIGINPQTAGRWHWHGYLRDGVFEEC